MNYLDPEMQFLVAFAKLDLNLLDENAWVNLRVQFRGFLRGDSNWPKRKGTPRFIIQEYPFPCVEDIDWVNAQTASTDEYLSIHSRIRRLLEDVAGTRIEWEAQLRTGARRSRHRSESGGLVFAPRSVERMTLSLTVSPEVTAGRWSEWSQLPDNKRPPLSERATFNVKAHFGDAVVFKALLLLWLVPTNTVRRCELCGELFAAARRDSRGCSLACARKLYWKSPKGKRKLREVYEANNWRLGVRRRKSARRQSPRADKT